MRSGKMEQYIGERNLYIVDAMQKIDKNAHGILFVVDEDGHLVGSLTDGDIRRWLIKSGNLQVPISEIMNRRPKFLFCGEQKKSRDYITRERITALPILDGERKIIDIILKESRGETEVDRSRSLKGASVIIMAGGKGTRLYPYTKILPKPLIPIGDIPIIERIIDQFCVYGISDYYLTVNYKKNMIKSYFADIDHEYNIEYVEEEVPLGTAGSLRLINQIFQQPVIVTNCDILINADYGEIFRYHEKSKNELTIVSAVKNIVVPYGVLNAGEQGVIVSMEEKPRLSYLINTGLYILNPKIIKQIPEGMFYHMTDLADLLIKNGKRVGMYPVSEESFLDMGEFEEMKRMEKRLNEV